MNTPNDNTANSDKEQPGKQTSERQERTIYEQFATLKVAFDEIANTTAQSGTPEAERRNNLLTFALRSNDVFARRIVTASANGENIPGYAEMIAQSAKWRNDFGNNGQGSKEQPTEQPKAGTKSNGRSQEQFDDVFDRMAAEQAARPNQVPCDYCGRLIPSGKPHRVHGNIFLCPKCYIDHPEVHPQSRGPQNKTGKQKGPSVPPGSLLVTNAEFVAKFTPPDYTIEGLTQSGFVYSMTGKTGSGKTALLLRIAMHKLEGLPLFEREVDPGKVLYLAGENVDDVTMRWIKLCEVMQPENADSMIWLPRVVSLSDEELQRRIDAEILTHGPFDIMIADTSAAYFTGNDENDNVQMIAHAKMFRRFAEAGERPTVIIACHPVKNAGDDNLIPRGGSSFLAEIDGNFTARMTSHSPLMTEMHWQGKFRGTEFSAMTFTLKPDTSPALVDSKGRKIWTVWAEPATKEDMTSAENVRQSRCGALLLALHENPRASLAELAEWLGWRLANGEPHKMKVSRVMKDLEDDGCVRKISGHYELTKAGKQALAEAAKK